MNEIKQICEFPVWGGLCGKPAVSRGVNSGNPYCKDHTEHVKRFNVEETKPLDAKLI